MSYSREDINEAVRSVCSRLGVALPHPLQKDYEAGRLPSLLSYEKIEKPQVDIPPLERFIIGASSCVNQPCHFYDIFRACRHVTLIQLLYHALEELTPFRVKNLDNRCDRLCKATTYDDFESVLYEIVTAWRYQTAEETQAVEFVEESSTQKTPDIKIILRDGIETFCECKKLDRITNESARVRRTVRDRLTPILDEFYLRRTSVLGELTYMCDPSNVSEARLRDAFRDSTNFCTTIVDPDFILSSRKLPPYTSATYKLYPSPEFYWDRYDFRVRSEWFGIVHKIKASYAENLFSSDNKPRGRSTWLDELSWDSAIKWKIGNPDIINQYRRFAFNRVFRGLQQINHKGPDTVLHLWLESDYNLEGRCDVIRYLSNSIRNNGCDNFGWLIINELLWDISPKGMFDLIEHAHFISGPSATIMSPRVSTIFTSKIPGNLRGEFGIGHKLPDIDEEYE